MSELLDKLEQELRRSRYAEERVEKAELKVKRLTDRVRQLQSEIGPMNEERKEVANLLGAWGDEDDSPLADLAQGLLDDCDRLKQLSSKVQIEALEKSEKIEELETKLDNTLKIADSLRNTLGKKMAENSGLHSELDDAIAKIKTLEGKNFELSGLNRFNKREAGIQHKAFEQTLGKLGEVKLERNEWKARAEAVQAKNLKLAHEVATMHGKFAEFWAMNTPCQVCQFYGKCTKHTLASCTEFITKKLKEL